MPVTNSNSGMDALEDILSRARPRSPAPRRSSTPWLVALALSLAGTSAYGWEMTRPISAYDSIVLHSLANCAAATMGGRETGDQIYLKTRQALGLQQGEEMIRWHLADARHFLIGYRHPQ